MIRVLLTGAGSYIGEAVAGYLQQLPGHPFQVESLDVRGEGWQRADFAGYQAVLHVAGIAHQRELPEQEGLYLAVNRDLPLAVARRAKAAGVAQFVFMSSMSVYGLTCGHITADTQPAPTSYYGKSKWEAEQALAPLAGDTFQVAVLRPPMIYGKGCKGNYPRLSALVQKAPVFPRVRNQRSMLYIKFLCSFLAGLLESGQGGLFFPQNEAYVTTEGLVRAIAHAHGRRVWQVRGFGWLLRLLSRRVATIGKVFGSLTYDQDMSGAFRKGEDMDFVATIEEAEA